MTKDFFKYLDIHSRGKRDKNGIFDVVTCSIFDKYIFVIDVFEASKKCKVSLVDKYIRYPK